MIEIIVHGIIDLSSPPRIHAHRPRRTTTSRIQPERDLQRPEQTVIAEHWHRIL
jgi:hypothetical protein